MADVELVTGEDMGNTLSIPAIAPSWGAGVMGLINPAKASKLSSNDAKIDAGGAYAHHN